MNDTFQPFSWWGFVALPSVNHNVMDGIVADATRFIEELIDHPPERVLVHD